MTSEDERSSGSIVVHHGDCLEVLRTLSAESVDAVVTDPPAGISFMGKEWDRGRGGRREWVQWLSERLAECLRVAKPGAHALVWALPRTSHWTACALEDAGWHIEDRVAHIFGTGFPKHKSRLKPAVEDWWLAKKSGGAKWLGVDACRTPTNGERLGGGAERFDGNTGSGWDRPCRDDPGWQAARAEENRRRVDYATAMGRWPTNLVLSHHPECNGDCHPDCPAKLMDKGSGGASRFFPGFLYCPKSSRVDRGVGNAHPTVKAVPLMRWLCKLVTPLGGTVLDPFAGSGSTGFAAEAEGFHAILIEQVKEYVELIERRQAALKAETPLFK